MFFIVSLQVWLLIKAFWNEMPSFSRISVALRRWEQTRSRMVPPATLFLRQHPHLISSFLNSKRHSLRPPPRWAARLDLLTSYQSSKSWSKSLFNVFPGYWRLNFGTANSYHHSFDSLLDLVLLLHWRDICYLMFYPRKEANRIL